VENKGKYKGQWSDEDLAIELMSFFSYCEEVELKPTAPGLRLWLGVHRDTIHAWRTQKEKYGVKSDLINTAYDWMETYLQGNIDKYPTGSIFLLKTTHGHVDASTVDITTNGQNINNTPEEVNDIISKLGLDKKLD
jgi:hypothetical protein